MGIEEYFEQRFVQLALPGLSCSFGFGEQIQSYAYGLSDIESKRSLDVNSIFNIASVGKLITSVCILKLAEENSFTLNTPITELLSKIPSKWNSVKISHLLTHSSGIINYTDVPDYWAECSLDVPKARILEYVNDRDLTFEPGSNWKYSNTGFYLLGMIIEKVSKLDYFDFALKLISECRPGLKILKTDDRLNSPRKVTGYLRKGDEFVRPPYYSNSGTFSAGGFSATLHDFLEFERALFNGEILSKGSLAMLTQPFLKEDGSVLSGPDVKLKFEMTHGLFRFRRSGRTQLAHGGEIMGFKTDYMRMVDADFSAIVSANTDTDFDGLEMLNEIYDLAITKY